MDYKEEYLKLVTRINRLEEENAMLRKRLAELNGSNEEIIVNDGYLCENALPVDNPFVSMNSPSSEKVALFKSLFKGRSDVYARRWVSKTTAKSGYSPVCVNEWDNFLCDKKTTKCKDCKNRKFAPLTDSVIVNHLKGKNADCSDVIGVYPITNDDKCSFIVVDFDDGEWQKDLSAFRSTCEGNKISVAVERSRSGCGGHAWLFFGEEISAADARKIASILLTKAMENRHEISLSSYDRLIPAQDFLPDGGLGNMVALPLQGQARKNNNSVFVDSNFQPYPDQWAYLSQIKKINISQINNILKDAGRNVLGELSDTDCSSLASRRNLTPLDFPSIVHIALANMVYIKKQGISECALNAIKRIAAFANPEFYRAQRMRLAVYGIPRIVATHEETDKFILLPRGCLGSMLELLDDIGVIYSLTDDRNVGKNIDVEFDGELREEQLPAFSALAEKNTGVLSATTAFGKTVIGAKLIAEKKVNTLILVHNAALLNQWIQSLLTFLKIKIEFPEQPKKRGRKKEFSLIGQLGATKNTLNGYIDIAIMQSLFDGNEVKDIVKNYGMVIVDECHHVPAVSFEKIMKAVNAKYVYGLTATPVRQDGKQKIIFMQCGDIRYKVSAKEQAKKHGFDHLVIPRFTAFRMPLTADKNNSIQRTFEKLCESQTRNDMIVNDVIASAGEGKCILVLTERRSHAEALAKNIESHGVVTFLLVGAESAKIKREKLASIKDIPAENNFVIVATGKYVGEGFDEARLDTLFLAMPISWKGKLAQYTGRLHRRYDGKKRVTVYDYVDINVGMLEGMYHKRVAGYRSIGYEISIVEQGQKSGILFDKFTYAQVFTEDIISAQKSITISCPALRQKPVADFFNVVKSILCTPEITIITRNPENLTEKERNSAQNLICKLNKEGFTLIFKDDIHGKYAVIDNSLIWYGNISFLSYVSREDTSLRFSDKVVAEELLSRSTGE